MPLCHLLTASVQTILWTLFQPQSAEDTQGLAFTSFSVFIYVLLLDPRAMSTQAPVFPGEPASNTSAPVKALLFDSELHFSPAFPALNSCAVGSMQSPALSFTPSSWPPSSVFSILNLPCNPVPQPTPHLSLICLPNQLFPPISS